LIALLPLLTGIPITLLLLAGALSATLLSGVLSALILLTGILIGLVRIIRMVHRNVSSKLSPLIARLVVSHRLSGKSCVKNRQVKQDYFTNHLPASSAASQKRSTLKNIANKLRLRRDGGLI
jgi:hypothetical protein